MSVNDLKIVEEETPADSLELVVVEKSVGHLQTNIRGLELYIDKRLEDYKPENYMGDADLAKKDRAELNKAKDKIGKARREIISELMKPYSDFEERCKALEKKVDLASKALDEIVKIKENEEKNKKREQIEKIWKEKNFELFPLEKIFNSKWLNKGFKEKDISAEMDSVIDRTYKDLKTIERFVDDAETIKAHYLMNLDIAETIQYGDELQRQKEIAQKEKAEREEREHQQAISEQKNALVREALNFEQNKQTENLAEQALASAKNEEPAKPTRKEFVVSIKCFDEDLMKLKAAMNALGIEYSVEELTF